VKRQSRKKRLKNSKKKKRPKRNLKKRINNRSNEFKAIKRRASVDAEALLNYPGIGSHINLGI
jgi:hypothetical protein